MNARPMRRRGTTSVEMAFALPVLLFFLFGLFEYGRAQMTANVLRNACRQAARQGALQGVTSDAVKAKVKDLVALVVDRSAVTVDVKDASSWDASGTAGTSSSQVAAMNNLELTSAEPRQLFLVQGTVNYSSVAMFNLPYFSGLTLTGQSFMRHE